MGDSPNDEADDELPLDAGDIVKAISDMDEDGDFCLPIAYFLFIPVV